MEEPEDWEIPEFAPWTPEEDGKGLINASGQLLTWRTNEFGDPHHDDIASQEGFPYNAKVAIRPNGLAIIPSPDSMHLFNGVSREEAEAILAREAPKHGLHFERGYTSATHGVCKTCGDPLKGEFGTFCPRCSWSENDANLDSDPLSNPPDPTVDLHRGIQATTIPSHRWTGAWLQAVEDF